MPMVFAKVNVLKVRKTMKKLILLLPLLFLGGCAITEKQECVPNLFAKAGAGIKTQETTIEWWDGTDDSNFANKISARFEAGVECGSWSGGISHHSNYFVGRPFNDHSEYSKTELFVDYKWVWGL